MRRLPHNVEAEIALLGAIMVNNRAFERVSEYLRPEHFIIAENAATYAAAAQLIDSGRVADPVTLRSWASTDQHVSQAGGFDYLIKLADCAVTPINAAEYGRELYDLAIRRSLIAIGEDIVNSAYAPDQGTAATALIEAAEQNLFDLADSGSGSANDVHHVSASLTEAFDMARKAIDCREAGVLPGISTGIADIDKLTNGLHKAELTVLAGRPSSGKSQTALNIARNVASAYRTRPGPNGKPERVAGGVVLFFSMEMGHHQLGANIQAPSTRVGSFALRGGNLTREELFEAEELTGYLQNMLMNTGKSVYEHVVYDSEPERDFADQLEKNDAIKVYAKLPGWFKVPTPLGTYNPDWAVLVDRDGQERLYFVVETKSSLFAEDLRDHEGGKIQCGRAHFSALAVGENPAIYEKFKDVEGLLTYEAKR